MTITGNILIRYDHLRSALEIRIPELKKTEKDTHFTLYVEASERFQDSKIACLLMGTSQVPIYR